MQIAPLNRNMAEGGIVQMRSMLFVPADDRRKIAKALQTDADRIVIDLEDAVAHARKAEAREALADAYESLRGEAERRDEFEAAWRNRAVLRVNALSTDWWAEDVRCAAAVGIHRIMLPKSERAEDIRHFAERWSTVSGLPLELFPLLETAVGVERAGDIAGAHGCVARLAIGTVDLAVDLGVEISEDQTEFLYARSRIVFASAAAGLPGPIDAVETSIDDTAYLLKRCGLARQLGFAGKMAIHPKQLPPIHQVWAAAPPEEAEEARRIVEAFEEAERAGKSVVRVDGRMVDYPVYKQALRRLN